MSARKRKKNGSLNKWFIVGIAAFLIFIVPSLFLFKKDYQKNSSGVLSIANPASVNCTKVGGTNAVMEGPNGQYGLCQFPDDMICEEWALYRGECPVGGVKTTGFDTIEQKYCAWAGGQTLAVPNAQCTLPNGQICSDESLYNGTCLPT